MSETLRHMDEGFEENKKLLKQVAKLEGNVATLRRALDDVVSVFHGGEQLVTEERREAWIAALKDTI